MKVVGARRGTNRVATTDTWTRRHRRTVGDRSEGAENGAASCVAGRHDTAYGNTDATRRRCSVSGTTRRWTCDGHGGGGGGGAGVGDEGNELRSWGRAEPGHRLTTYTALGATKSHTGARCTDWLSEPARVARSASFIRARVRATGAWRVSDCFAGAAAAAVASSLTTTKTTTTGRRR